MLPESPLHCFHHWLTVPVTITQRKYNVLFVCSLQHDGETYSKVAIETTETIINYVLRTTLGLARIVVNLLN